MMPSVAVLIPTYNRVNICEDTIWHIDTNLKYDGLLHIYIGDDGNHDLREWETVLPRNDKNRTTALRGPKRGLGANLNMLLWKVKEDNHLFVLQLDDDHWLKQPLNLTPHVEKLRDDTSAGWIRLMGIGAHNYRAHLEGSYWRVDWDSPELYLPSNRPHLKHLRFHWNYGLYPEDRKLGETEDGFCHQCKDHWRKHGGPDVLVPLDVATESSWDHVGDSWQLRGL